MPHLLPLPSGYMFCFHNLYPKWPHVPSFGIMCPQCVHPHFNILFHILCTSLMTYKLNMRTLNCAMLYFESWLEHWNEIQIISKPNQWNLPKLFVYNRNQIHNKFQVVHVSMSQRTTLCTCGHQSFEKAKVSCVLYLFNRVICKGT